jgi:uncharacterized protein (TIGR02996 family)
MTPTPSPFAAEARAEVLLFLDQIKAHPDDDSARLVFADWLQENGTPAESDRGELMRIQVLRHQFLASDPRQDSLGRREKALLSQYRDLWVGDLMDHLTWRFDRGLLHLEGRIDKLLSSEVAGLARPDTCLWLESLTLHEVRTAQVGQLEASPFLPYLAALDLGLNRFHHHGLVNLVRSPQVQRLYSLGLAGNRVGPPGVRAIAASPHLARLAALDLRGNRIFDEGAEYLRRSPHLQQLRSLRLKGNRITTAAQAAIRLRFGNRVSFD